MNNSWFQTFHRHKLDFGMGLIIFVTALITFLESPVYAFSDSKYTLVVSESLLKHRSFALDHFALPRLEKKYEGNHFKNGDIYHLEWIGDQLYYYHPPGSSVLSVPYVALMDLFGLSVINQDGSYNLENEIKQQVILAAVLMALLASIFYFASRLALPLGWSVVIAVGGAFGTQVWSTMSRGLWSDTWGVLLSGLIIWMLLATACRKASFPPVLMGTLLAWTYFVRPTNASQILGVTIYVFVYHRRALLRYAATGLIWFGLFILYSWYNFGKVLPNYYSANRLTFLHFGEALAGNLISPARGLLVYVPVLVFIFYLLARYRNKIVFPRLAVLAISIVTIHWLMTSGFPHWWGGFSYGSRLMGGVVPWLVLLSILGVQATLKARAEQSAKSQPAGYWRTQNALGGLLLLVSILMNAMGATIPATQFWNERPTSVDQRPSRLWDWRYPQFLAGFLRPPVPLIFPPADVRVEFSRRASEPYLWYGWSINEEIYRWADGHEATVIFALDEIGDAQLNAQLAPLIIPGKLDVQRVKISLNGRLLETLRLTDPAAKEYSWALPKQMLQQRNILTFELPDARTPRSMSVNEDTRKLALAVFWLEIRTSNAGSAKNDEKRTLASAPLPTGGYAAEVDAIDPPTELKAGEIADLKVKVKNVSGAIWSSVGQNDGVYQIKLGNHWRDVNGRMIIMDDARAVLPHDVRPGREIELLLTIKAPQTPGDYILELDMVQERVAWFAGEESRPAKIKIAVR